MKKIRKVFYPLKRTKVLLSEYYFKENSRYGSLKPKKYILSNANPKSTFYWTLCAFFTPSRYCAHASDISEYVVSHIYKQHFWKMFVAGVCLRSELRETSGLQPAPVLWRQVMPAAQRLSDSLQNMVNIVHPPQAKYAQQLLQPVRKEECNATFGPKWKLPGPERNNWQVEERGSKMKSFNKCRSWN